MLALYLIPIILAFSPRAALGVSSDVATTILPEEGFDPMGFEFGQSGRYPARAGLAERQAPSSTTTSTVSITTSNLISNDLGEGSTFFIPTKSNNPWQHNITDMYTMYPSSIIAYSVHYNADFPQDSTPNVFDIEENANPVNFTACVQQCAQYNVVDRVPGAYFTICYGVSWVDNFCYLKSGGGLAENMAFTPRTDAISAVLHFLIP